MIVIGGDGRVDRIPDRPAPATDAPRPGAFGLRSGAENPEDRALGPDIEQVSQAIAAGAFATSPGA
jgi:hypothetical protein